MFRKLLALLIVPVSLAFAAPPTAANQSVSHASDARALSVVAPTTPAPVPNTDLFTMLAGAALIGATAPSSEKKKTASRQINLSRTYLFEGTRYGPGRNVTVPGDFPELDDNGDVIFEEGTKAAANQLKARTMASPPSTGGVNTGEGGAGTGETVSGYPRAQLEDMKKDELRALAAEKNIAVAREDGTDGEPLVDDYVRELSKPA